MFYKKHLWTKILPHWSTLTTRMVPPQPHFAQWNWVLRSADKPVSKIQINLLVNLAIHKTGGSCRRQELMGQIFRTQKLGWSRRSSTLRGEAERCRDSGQKEYFKYVFFIQFVILSSFYYFIFGNSIFYFCHTLESMKNGDHNFDPMVFLHDECPPLKWFSF